MVENDVSVEKENHARERDGERAKIMHFFRRILVRKNTIYLLIIYPRCPHASYSPRIVLVLVLSPLLMHQIAFYLHALQMAFPDHQYSKRPKRVSDVGTRGTRLPRRRTTSDLQGMECRPPSASSQPSRGLSPTPGPPSHGRPSSTATRRRPSSIECTLAWPTLASRTRTL